MYVLREIRACLESEALTRLEARLAELINPRGVIRTCISQMFNERGPQASHSDGPSFTPSCSKVLNLCISRRDARINYWRPRGPIFHAHG